MAENVSQSKEVSFLSRNLKDFYLKQTVEGPPTIDAREFGIGFFQRKIAQRHLAFPTNASFNLYLKQEAPFYISYSGAYYQFPERKPMQAKDFLKTDLFYEFDADDLQTDCKQLHDSWKCTCGNSGKGDLEVCPECSAHVSVDQWVCNECLDAVKKQVLRLIDFFENDFNITEGIALNYSGSKGYHMHVRNEAIHSLSQNARIELLDYLTGNDLNLELHGFMKKGKNKNSPWSAPKIGRGWSKRMLVFLNDFFRNTTPEQLAVITNTTITTANKIIAKREEIISQLQRGILFSLERKTDDFWHAVLTHAVDSIKLDLDRQTSVDAVKILRVPDTLHGGTFLQAKRLHREALKGFDPLQECVVFNKTPVKVKVLNTPSFSLGGKHFSAMTSLETELPLYAALYLLAKGKALLP